MLHKEKLEAVFDREFQDVGEDFVACCPIHEEKSPSFYVHKEKYLVHCFGCGAHGTLVEFTNKYLGVEDGRERLGLSFEDEVADYFFQYIPEKDPRIYPESYLGPFRKEIHKYVIRRGFHENTLKDAEALYDHHTQRQVFPHRNREGRLVGAIGRACREQQRRWHFYWGYDKGRFIYRAPHRSSLRPVWVVEGVFDALWLYQHGYNAVATLGSKPTKYQIEELLEFNALVLAYDNDAAGIEGTRILYEKLHKHVQCLFPIYPKDINDIMEMDPRELQVVNSVEWELIRTSNRSSRVLSEQEKSLALA